MTEKSILSISISVVLLVVAASASLPGYLHLTRDASTFPAQESYDYIVVGGGTAGCPLAATLSNSHTVLLLERGGAPPEFPSLSFQEGFLPTLLLGGGGGGSGPAESFVSEEGVPNSRGRVLGGSSAINAGFYSRAHPSFFSPSWNLSLVEDSYAWVERSVAFHPAIRTWQSALLLSLLEANVTPFNGFSLHHLPGTKIGATTFDSSGRRHSAADLLSSASPANIRVALRASAQRILFRGRSAVGVLYRDSFGRFHRASTRPGGEVLLSAGALGSAQLLLLSGIGPRPYLASWGIPVITHNPAIGEFLYDNPRNGISIIPPFPLEDSLIQVVGIPSDGSAFLEAASTVISHITVATIVEKVPGPSSVGFLRLASLDVRDGPIVRFNYFARREDVDRCVAGLRRIGSVLDSRTMQAFAFGKKTAEFWYVGRALPRNRSDAAAMENFCRSTVATLWHYHGGCVVGRAVDEERKVKGALALRVVDGSTFSVSPGTNPQATLMMMGRYMGKKIVEERARGKMRSEIVRERNV